MRTIPFPGSADALVGPKRQALTQPDPNGSTVHKRLLPNAWWTRRPQALVLLFILLLLTAFPSLADIDVILPDDIIADQTTSLSLSAEAPLIVKKLPSHPRVTWLSETPLEAREGNDLDIRFLVTGAGTIQLPPLVCSLGGTNLLQQIPAFRSEANSIPENTTRMHVLWNLKKTPPDHLVVGQQIDLEIILRVVEGNEGSADFPMPDLVLDGVRWETFGASVRNPRRNRLFRFGGRYYQQLKTKLDGRPAIARRYKARFTVQGVDRVTGVIVTSAGHSGEMEAHLSKVSIPVKRPPKPTVKGLNTGLLGDWTLTGNVIAPTNATAPLEIEINIEGRGDHRRLQPLDFSRHGFLDGGNSLKRLPDTSYDRWHGVFRQTLLPDGQQDHFPALNLLTFDTAKADWATHSISDSIIIPGASSPWLDVKPIASLGPAIRRPALANLHPGWFALFAAAPFLPILFGGLRRITVRKPDPSRQRWKDLMANLRDAGDTPLSSEQEAELLALLRLRADLPPGADLKQVASTVSAPLSSALEELAASRFTSSASRPACHSVSKWIVRAGLPLFLFLLITPGEAAVEADFAELTAANDLLAGRNLSEAIPAYESLIKVHPGHPVLHQNLAIAQARAGDLPAAAASIHTARLLDPLHAEARGLQFEIFQAMGRPELARKGLLLRPDQWLVVATCVWALGWLLFALRRLRSTPLRGFLIAGGLVLFLSLVCFGLAIHAHRATYARGQVMVQESGSQGERAPGEPDATLPIYRPGDVLRVDPELETDSHLGFRTSSGSVYLPKTSMTPVW